MAGTHSGVGKTTVATGLMAALRRHRLRVGCAKVGPDYIDPGYHQLATGRPPRNLDSFLTPERFVPALAARAGDGCDLLVIEGVMGLYDGASSPTEASSTGLPAASTATVAALTGSPVVLVVDAAAMSQSVAALVHGFATWHPAVSLSGVILNKVATDAHEEGLRRALRSLGIPVLGALHRNPDYAWRDRHLGLVPVAERPAEIGAALDRLAAAITRSVDLEAVVAVARSAAATRVTVPLPVPRPLAGGGRVRVAVAAGKAFGFVYSDNLECLAAAGAELVPFDPLSDTALPEQVSGLYAGGGFPEVYAPGLAENRPLLDAAAAAARAGLPVWAECGGLLWLTSSLDGHRLCGVVPASARMTDRLSLGYRRAEVMRDNPVAPAGAVLRGHEFHYSIVDPPGDALRVGDRNRDRPEGFAGPGLFATYLHLHLASEPGVAERFVATCAVASASGATRAVSAGTRGRPDRHDIG